MKSPAHPELPHQVEIDLIKACATTVATEAQGRTIRRLVGECQDWQYVIEVCQTHGVSSLVCFTLDAQASDLVPREILEILQARFKANACRNLFLTRELLIIVQEFQNHGIKVIPFKGPLLAINTHGNVALREFLDLDILVPRKDFHHARELLATRDYLPPAGQTTTDYIQSQLGCDYIREDGRVALELHWSFVQKWLGFHMDLEAVWSAATPIQVGQVPVLTLPADITLLYLCAHGTKHRWTRLCWVVDVAEVLRSRPELDWPALLALAEHSGCQRTLFIGLHLARIQLQAAIPDQVWAGILQDQVAITLARILGEQMFAPGKNSVHQWSSWDVDWFHIRTKERWREKLVYLGQLAIWVLQPSDKDRQWIHLPHWLDWLYPFLRPIRVAWQSLPAVSAL